jgi:hypothetical protein
MDNREKCWNNYIGVFDYFIGKLFIEKSSFKRYTTGYGRLRDFRLQPWGVEYRSLPSYVFIDKKIAKIIFKMFLSLTKTIINYSENNMVFVFKSILDEKDYCLYAGLDKNEYKTLMNYVYGFYKRNKEDIVKYWCKKNTNKKIHINWVNSEYEISEGFKKELENKVNGLISNKEFKIFINKTAKYPAGMCFTRSSTPHNKSILLPYVTKGISICIDEKVTVQTLYEEIQQKLAYINTSKEKPTTWNLFPDEVI